ncbi:MAG TPA: CBS domain-containing protein [Chromatiales bacterium]|nr:CBS domain-containing protein [Thiotrichales bacterium]HIP69732.1 CBS domain-containing protein [Chromatiales bacterium]
MNADQPPSSSRKGWLERLTLSLLGEPSDREQILKLLRAAEHRNLLDRDALSMIEGVFQVSEMQVRDIMIPRAQMAVVNEEDDIEAMLKIARESGHSRFPVIDDRQDMVIGILLAKDLLRYLTPGKTEEFVLEDVMRPAIFIPESKRLNILLREFRASKNHMAVVVDEYGSPAGLVTIEDVLEQIVGEIDDEHDKDEIGQSIMQREPFRYTIKALTPIEDFNAYFKTDFDEDKFDTIGGFITNYFGHLPRRDEHIRIRNFDFKVIKADSRRVHLLEMTTRPTAPV